MPAEIDIGSCPRCQGALETGFVQAPSFGIFWTTDPNVRWFAPFWSRKWRRLQKDWWGFPKFCKQKLPAQRCVKCHLVIIQYGNDDAQ